MSLLVCATLCLHKELRSVTNYLIAGLAVADLGVGALAVPFSVVLSMDYTLCFYTCLFLTCFPLVTTQFSILLLLLVAVNAHLKIRLPTSYTIYVKKKWMMLMVAFCWLFSCLIGFSPMMGWNRFQQYVTTNRTIYSTLSIPSERSIIGYNLPYGGFLSKVYFSNRRSFNYSEVHGSHMGACSFTAVFSPEYQVYFVFFACTLVPLVIMLGLYADIFRVIHGHFMSRSIRATKRGEANMASTLFMLMGIFCACWIPLNVLNSVRLLCGHCVIPEDLNRLAVLLSHTNSLANPLVYAMRRKNFGQALRSVFFRYVLFGSRVKACCARSKVYPQHNFS
ncbi:hypothetical protein NDU88_011232 [Pleurodeles waltl]|uniref:G-protein coupled receptors family 1 profile domain-containing protein n=1 Tax=Pleurodeles waltl TaxID=8319 RepID=A0AAV7PXV3_PLEWA|nr:hypothetical protein NDU88_011232 [Pleurodeles waltl]